MLRPSRPAAVAAFIVSCLVLSLFGPVALAQSGSVDYRPPVDAPVFDPFRAPDNPYGAGNRGLDYRAEPGQEVRAAADGQVVFVGPIAGATHVVVLHDDGVRTSYSFLQSASVVRGQRVGQGHVVGIAGGDVHFGARAGDAYLDPADLFAGEGPPIRLVPLEPDTLAGERKGLLGQLKAGGRLIMRGARAVLRTGARWGHLATRWVSAPLTLGLAFGRGVYEWLQPCTPADVEPPPNHSRAVVVRVSGLASNTPQLRSGGGIGAVDAHEMGLAGSPTYTFSYGDPGSTVEDGAEYDSADTQVSFEESGAALAETLARIRQEHPGRAIVIVAHSQGGLVARQALKHDASGVTNLVTLATPHHGSDAATALEHGRGTPVGRALSDYLAPKHGIDPDSPAVRDLVETSDFIRSLGPLPSSVKLTSIAAAGDLFVPVPRAHVSGADNRVIGSDSLFGDHSSINDRADAHREVRLALAGMPQTCRGLIRWVWDHTRGEFISVTVDTVAIGSEMLMAVPSMGIRLP
jgi:pimeloyl-ACP methyl ester carboxylesterase